MVSSKFEARRISLFTSFCSMVICFFLVSDGGLNLLESRLLIKRSCNPLTLDIAV